ncbi:3-dehydroquinate synthase [Frankliniella fusca]|uniref:3-dehydroquinate synthase n=1 Tax=Frankliniella fusca TaxID=407009 RepID=A0AAE1L8J0_9NEOP|nr:3-dehydroquinate synthase [Frankliniella fusca]
MSAVGLSREFTSLFSITREELLSSLTPVQKSCLTNVTIKMVWIGEEVRDWEFSLLCVTYIFHDENWLDSLLQWSSQEVLVDLH